MSTAPIVVGLDLSITATGIATGEGVSTISAKSGFTGDGRLVSIEEQVRHAVGFADLVVMESPVLRSSAALALGMLHGAVRVSLLVIGVPYAEVAPASLKKYATGRGNAGKPEMAVALYKRTELELGDDNQVDAWWLRAMGLDALGAAPVPLPAAQRAVMEKVKWPLPRKETQ